MPSPLDPWLLQPLRLGNKQLENCASDVQAQLADITSLLDSSAGKLDQVEFPGGTREFDGNAIRPA
jgi:hypothetical protein